MAAGGFFDETAVADADACVVAALERSTALVEFAMDGRLLRANDKFLHAMGYEEAEVIGIHHSAFVDPEYATSESYRSFWERLRRGEYIADRFRRVGKCGREVWIQASYNPIMGADGLPAKIVKFATDITQQEVVARDARGQLQAISRSQAVIEFDVNGIILDANENFCRLVGYTLGEIRGQRHTIFVDPEYVDSDEYTNFWMSLRRGEYQASRFRRLGKGGREIWIEAAYNPIIQADGKVVKVVKFATDITAQETFARDARGQMQAISRSQAVIEFMADGTILWANDNFCRLMGYSLAEIRARHHRMFVDPDYAGSEAYADFWELLSRGAYQSGKYRRKGKGGREVWIQASYNPVYDERGRQVKVVKYATDITEQVVREQEAGQLRELNAELQRAKQASDEAIRVKSQFLATMSHELRTPMNGVLGMLEAALGSEMHPTQRDQLATARDSAAALLRILNDILDFSKLESGNLELEQTPYSLQLVVDGVVSVLRMSAKARGLSLLAHIDVATPEWMLGDPARIRQILTNLVGNAVKFTDEGSVEIAVRIVGAQPERVRIEVRDTGPGIPEDVQVKLFQRFSQADASTTRRYGGTGLGLAISRELVERMNGHIGVESREGVGSVFWFELPVIVASEPRAAMIASDAEHRSLPACNILVAEDNPVNQKVLGMLMQPHPHRLTFVNNGAEAVEAVQAGTFDMVFMDVSMPVMDGPEATQAIRKMTGPASRIPIIALTANAMAGDREAYLAAGMSDYVSKPIVLEKVLAAIGRNLPDGRNPDEMWLVEEQAAARGGALLSEAFPEADAAFGTTRSGRAA